MADAAAAAAEGAVVVEEEVEEVGMGGALGALPVLCGGVVGRG